MKAIRSFCSSLVAKLPGRCSMMLVRSLWALFCMWCMYPINAQMVPEQPPPVSYEQIVFEAIRNAEKSIYVVATKPMSDPIFAELAIKYKSSPEGKRINFSEFAIMSGSVALGSRFARMHALTWYSPKYADWPEMLIIDHRIVVQNFDSLDQLEVIEDSDLAERHISELKKSRKSATKMGKEQSVGRELLGDLIYTFLSPYRR